MLHEEQYLIPSGTPPVAAGVKHSFGLVIKPDQMVELIHDFIPSAPVPFDAQHVGLGIEDGSHPKIRFYFQSSINPIENCVELDPNHFLNILKRAGDGLIPLDSELEGIEASNKFTVILLRVKSDHFPAHSGNDLPLCHLRYEAGELTLVNVFDAIHKERRIRISDKR